MSEAKVGIEAWYMDTLDNDQRLPHRQVACSASSCSAPAAVRLCFHRTSLAALGEGYARSSRHGWRACTKEPYLCQQHSHALSRHSCHVQRCSSAAVLHHADSYMMLACRCEPNEPCSLSALRELGVLAWKLDADNHETDPRLAAIRKVRGYSYTVR